MRVLCASLLCVRARGHCSLRPEIGRAHATGGCVVKTYMHMRTMWQRAPVRWGRDGPARHGMCVSEGVRSADCCVAASYVGVGVMSRLVWRFVGPRPRRVAVSVGKGQSACQSAKNIAESWTLVALGRGQTSIYTACYSCTRKPPRPRGVLRGTVDCCVRAVAVS